MSTRLLTVRDLMAQLTLGETAARGLMRQIGFKVGRQWRCRPARLQQFILEQEHQAATRRTPADVSAPTARRSEGADLTALEAELLPR